MHAEASRLRVRCLDAYVVTRVSRNTNGVKRNPIAVLSSESSLGFAGLTSEFDFGPNRICSPGTEY
jgi:hypothetical protein